MLVMLINRIHIPHGLYGTLRRTSTLYIPMYLLLGILKPKMSVTTRTPIFKRYMSKQTSDTAHGRTLLATLGAV